MKFSQFNSTSGGKKQFKQPLNAPIVQKSIFKTFTAILAKCKLGLMKLSRRL